ncbi:MAG: hypothetical protein JSR82_17300 [Verrucomicrobia bacterium]|nr:hypothetical protein [Verrucomicrobiota bacterium]
MAQRCCLALLLLFLAPLLRAAEPVEVDVPYFTPLELKKYGGRKVDLVIESDDQGAIRYAIVDHTRTVLRPRLSSTVVVEDRYLRLYRGYDRVPLILRRTVPKEGGISEAGSLQKLYRLYRDRTGIQVFFRDTIATPQGSVRLRIVPATRPARS